MKEEKLIEAWTFKEFTLRMQEAVLDGWKVRTEYAFGEQDIFIGKGAYFAVLVQREKESDQEEEQSTSEAEDEHTGVAALSLVLEQPEGQAAPDVQKKRGRPAGSKNK